MKPVNMGAPSKSWENASTQNPVPTITNQPTEPVTVEEGIDNISNQMQMHGTILMSKSN